MTISSSNKDLSTPPSDISDDTHSWDIFYCPHIWADSQLRDAVTKSAHSSKLIKKCYTCKGKIRNYEIKTNSFIPHIHSTPNGKISNNLDFVNTYSNVPVEVTVTNDHPPGLSFQCQDVSEPSKSESCIPTISRQVDSSFRQKYTSYETPSSRDRHQRLRKSLKGIGCVVSLALNENSMKKRTQIQACSISVMIIAIVLISFVLVNFTSTNNRRNVVSTNIVPTQLSDSNGTSAAITSSEPELREVETITKDYMSSMPSDDPSVGAENISQVPPFIANILKNVKTIKKDDKRYQTKNESYEEKPKEIINRDLSYKFCSCQTNEVCMLDESSGKAICKRAVDMEDPTGCGGICALETEACQIVDRARGVRVCRLISTVTCSPLEWRCHNGLCVEATARCDGVVNCYDRSDEMYCDCDHTKEFRCGQSISCFPNKKLCDGVIDCWDGYDERNCTAECPSEQFTCSDGQCILQSRFCDGLTDCADGSDEPQGCGGCGPNEMSCNNHRCVPLTSRCNNVDNCGDNTDEINCS